MPFIYCVVNYNKTQQISRKSNGLPPYWEQDLKFDYNDSGDDSIEIILFESRFMMNDEIVGKISIPVSHIPKNKVVVEWVPIESLRKFVFNTELLCMFHISDSIEFSDEFDYFCVEPKWKRSKVDEEDIIDVVNNIKKSIQIANMSDVEKAKYLDNIIYNKLFSR